MKKIIALVICVLMVVAVFAACQQEAQPAAVAGGWQINDDATKGYLPDDVQTAFDKAAEGYKDMDLTPVAYLGSQVVAGSNYMILCKGSKDGSAPQLYMTVVYADLEGNASVSSVVNLDLGELEQTEVAEGTEAGLAGGFTVTDDYLVQNIPAEAQDAFDKAFEGFAGAGYDIMALLGTKVVSGLDYAYLTHQTLVTAEPINNIAVVFVYADTNKNAEIMNIVPLNLADYNQ